MSVEDSPVTSPQTMDNPWSKAPSVQSPTPATVSFSDIVQDEIQKHESLAQVTSKPLALIQVIDVKLATDVTRVTDVIQVTELMNSDVMIRGANSALNDIVLDIQLTITQITLFNEKYVVM